jgi:WD40 repeat protein
MTATSGGVVQFWDTDHRLELFSVQTGSMISFAAVDGTGARFATVGPDGLLHRWDVATRTEIGEPIDTGQSVTSLQSNFSGSVDANSWLVATGGADGSVRLWDAETGLPIGRSSARHAGPTATMSFDLGSNRLVSAGSDGMIRVWDVATGDEARAPLLAHDGAISSVMFDGEPAGSSLVVSSGADGTVRTWHIEEGREVGVLEVSEPDGGAGPISIDLVGQPDGSATLVTVDGGLMVRVWDLATGDRIAQARGIGTPDRLAPGWIGPVEAPTFVSVDEGHGVDFWATTFDLAIEP